MIEIRNLTKHFGPARAVEDVSFSVARGEVLGFLGPNGAGKSTTMKMITGFLAPTGGTAVVCGHDVVSDPIAARRRIGYLPEGAPLYPDMNPLSLMRFVAEAHGIPRGRRQARIDEVVSLVGLEGVRQQRIETLSKGYKRRVGLGIALLHDPDVLVLDEPTDGLDPNQKDDVRRLIRRMSPGKAIVASTHILEEVDAVCTRAIIIAEGRLLFNGTPASLRQRSRFDGAVEIEILAATCAGALKTLAGLEGVREVDDLGETEGLRRLLAVPDGTREILPSVLDLARGSGWQVRNVTVEKGRLEEVFREITLGELRPTVQATRPGAHPAHQGVTQ